jgi:beta-lactamase regulating signal transducer with metallopeptidase domain
MDFERWVRLLEGALAVALVRGTIVYLLAFAANSLGRKLSSQTRHLIWLGVIAAFLLLPLCWLTLPALRVGGWIRLEKAASHWVATVPLLARQEYMRLADGAWKYSRLTGRTLPTHLRLLPLSLLLSWLVGMLFLVCRLLAAGWKLRQLKREAAKDSGLLRLARELVGKGGAPGKLAVLRSPRCRVPFTFGLLRPVIVVPADAAAWTPGRLRSALVHELAHLRRRDVLAQSLAYGVCLLFWFIPPLWLACAALRREAETCCDQQVINRGFRRSQYARDLVELARDRAGRILLPVTSSEADSQAGLTTRIRNLLRLQSGKQPIGVLGAMKVLAIFLACLLPLMTVTCATKPPLVKQDDLLFGTWVNPTYEGQAERPGKWILFPDGSELDYHRRADTEPYLERRNVIQEAWIEANGDRAYKVRWPGDEVEVWTISKIHGGRGSKMVITVLTQPPPEGQGYGIYFRLE